MPISAREFQDIIDVIAGDDAAESEQAYRNLKRHLLTSGQREYADAVYENTRQNRAGVV